MIDKEKFKGFRKKLVDDNEAKYGKEIRQKYGEETVNKSNQKVQGMSQEQYDEVTNLAAEVLETLYAAVKTGDPAGELAQKASDLHRQWLCYYWDSYTKEAHAGVAQMYVDDPRFTAFGTVQPILNALVISLSPPERRGAANATFAVAMDLGIGLGAVILGFLAQKLGYEYMYGCSAIFALLALVMYFTLLRKKLPHRN